MQEIGDWLEELGLGQYRSVFAAEDIGADTLTDLTEDDLERLGLSLGHRKKLMRAIAALDTPQLLEIVERKPLSSDGAERRHLTVMFCDLVGSTALSSRLDPEDLRQIMLSYQDRVSGIVERFGGFVARYLGDGVLAYFGWPRAAEDDVIRAAAAGLEITGTVQSISTGLETLQARIGIATGLAVIGDMIGEGAAREQSVIGELPNLAARLQALAGPGSVLVSSGTRKLLGGGFDLEPLGLVELKGWNDPVPVWRVLGENRFATRFVGFDTMAVDAVVGREAELSVLQARWQQAIGGNGQVVLLSGEAGIGKSSTAAALIARTRPLECNITVFQCLPQHSGDPLHPIIRQIEFVAEFDLGDPPEIRRDKLNAMLAAADLAEDELAIFAEFLSLSEAGPLPAGDVDPVRRKARLFSVLLDYLTRLSRAAPLLILLEDAQWLDPTSLEFFERLTDRLNTMPVLLVVTARPEFAPFWPGRDNSVVCTLSRLGRAEVGRIIDAVARGKKLPAEVFEQIQTKTDGVPLFVEELTKTVLESDALVEEADRWLVRSPITLDIPATLHASLMARLDRLGSAKELAQTAAAIGREFEQPVLAAVSGLSGVRVAEGLERLVKSATRHHPVCL